MTPEGRELLRELLRAEEPDGRRLSLLLAELASKGSDFSPLARYLAIKEREDRARQAVLDREQWFRSFSWRLVGALFAFGLLGLALFVAWGGEQAFLASILFFAGGASFYLVVQTMTMWRGHKDRKALAEIQAQCAGELEALRQELKL